MKLKSLRDKAQVVALVSSVVCLVSGVWVAHTYLSKRSVALFWYSLLLAIVFAGLSVPRWKSFVALAILPISLWWAGGRPFATYHSTRPSPDGKYKLVTYRIPLLFSFPGQGSDASGYVQLQDSSGKVLNEGYVEIVQIVYDADWSAHEVRIGRGDNSYTWSLLQ